MVSTGQVAPLVRCPPAATCRYSRGPVGDVRPGGGRSSGGPVAVRSRKTWYRCVSASRPITVPGYGREGMTSRARRRRSFGVPATRPSVGLPRPSLHTWSPDCDAERHGEASRTTAPDRAPGTTDLALRVHTDRTDGGRTTAHFYWKHKLADPEVR